MSAELVARLRAGVVIENNVPIGPEAADRIEELDAENQRFAEYLDRVSDNFDRMEAERDAARAERDAEAALADRLANALVAFMAADSVGGPNSFDEWNDAMDDAEPKAVAALAAHRAARVGRDEGEQQQ